MLENEPQGGESMIDIASLESEGAALYESLAAKYGTEIPKQPERQESNYEMQLAMAKDLGLLQEFLDDEDENTRLIGALNMMKSWNEKDLNPSNNLAS